MCTIGCAYLENVYVFKNRDPIRGTPLDEWVEKYPKESPRMLIIKNNNGCYGGLNSEGVGIVGTFVNMKESQNNYFNGSNLIDILSCGDLKYIHKYLTENHKQLYGNLICSDGVKTLSFELNGEENDFISINNQYVATNHFQRINKQIQTITDPFISQWTHSRLERGRKLISNIKSENDIKSLLADHDGFRDYSICNHGKIPTSSSYIINCTERKILYCSGCPCEHKYDEYRL